MISAANNDNKGLRLRQAKALAPEAVKIISVALKPGADAPSLLPSYHTNRITRTTTIMEPFYVPAPLPTSKLAIVTQGVFTAPNLYLPNLLYRPSVIYDIVGNEVSVVALSDPVVVSSWQSLPPPRPAQPGSVVRVSSMLSSRPMPTDLQPVARQQTRLSTAPAIIPVTPTSVFVPPTHMSVAVSPLPPSPLPQPLLPPPLPVQPQTRPLDFTGYGGGQVLHPLTLTPGYNVDSNILTQAKPTPRLNTAFTNHSSSSTATATNATNNQNSSTRSSGPSRLTDGYIVLISISLLFACATLFYFYMSYYKRRKARRAHSSLSLSHSHASESSSPRMAVDKKHQEENEAQGTRRMLDSGTGIDFQQQRPTDAAIITAQTREVDAMQAHLILGGLPSARSRERYVGRTFPNLHEQDRSADYALKDQYLTYRRPGYMNNVPGALSKSVGYVDTSARPEIPDFSAAASRLPQTVDQISAVDWPAEVNKRISAIGLDSSPSGQPTLLSAQPSASVPPAQPDKPPPAFIQSKAGLGKNRNHSRFIGNQAIAASSTYPAEEPTDILFANYVDYLDKRALLDTSSANPSLNSTMGLTPSVRLKTRKLVRDSTKRSGFGVRAKQKPMSPVFQSHTAEPNKQCEQTGDAVETRGPNQSKSGHSLSLRTMLRSTIAAPKKDKQRVDSETQWDQPSIHELERDAADEQNMSPLLDSIESFSESYQFALRHKPPLGPLRVVEAHTPALPDELNINIGDLLFVIGEFADGWVLAINSSRHSECGMVPRRCLFFPTAPFMTAEAIAASTRPSSNQNVTQY